MLVIENIGKTYPNGVRALGGVSMNVGLGEVVAVVGGSGSGKSTMLRVVSGLDRPTYGKVVLDGDEITAPHEKIGIVFQEPRLLPWLSVEGNVGFGLADRPKEERDRRVGAQVDRGGLADKAKVWPREDVVTHDVDEAIVLADRVIVLRPRPGRILEEIVTDMPRPRDRQSAAFDFAKRRVLAALDRSLERQVTADAAETKTSAGAALWW